MPKLSPSMVTSVPGGPVEGAIALIKGAAKTCAVSDAPGVMVFILTRTIVCVASGFQVSTIVPFVTL